MSYVANKTKKELKRDHTHIVSFIAIALAIIGVLVGIAGFAFYQANNISHAATLRTVAESDLKNKVSSGGIVIDKDLCAMVPKFSESYTVSKGFDSEGDKKFYYDDYFISINIPAKGGSTGTKLGRDLKMTWPNAGFDNDGDRIDVVMTFLKDSEYWSECNPLSKLSVLHIFPENDYGSAGITLVSPQYCTHRDSAGNRLAGATGHRVACDVHIKLDFLKTKDQTPATGTFLHKFTDLDCPGWSRSESGASLWGDQWTEGIELISGHGDVFVAPDPPRVVKISKNSAGEANTWIWGTEPMNGSTYESGFVTSMKSGSEFWLHDAGGGVDILDSFDPKNIVTKAGTGGSITCNGKSGNIAVGWKCNRTVSIKPDTSKGYLISNITIKNTETDATTDITSKVAKTGGTYTFNNVQNNWEISATFVQQKFTVTFKDGFTGGIIKTQTNVAYGSAATAPDKPVHTGYTSGNWDKTFNNVTSDLTVTVPYTENSYKIIFNANANGDTSPLLTGSMSPMTMKYTDKKALTANAFARLDYTFKCWNTKADGTGVDYSNQKVVEKLIASNNGEITLYAQWIRHTHASLSLTAQAKEKAAIGDNIQYTITATNNGDVTLKNVAFTSALLGMNNAVKTTRLDCGSSITIPVDEATYRKVTEHDAIVGNVTNSIQVAALAFRDGFTAPSSRSTSVTTMVESNPKMTITKTAHNNFADQNRPVAGETIDYMVTVANEGDITLNEINVADILSNGETLALDFGGITSLAPNTSMSANVTYTITQDDVDNGGLINSATGTAKDPSRPDYIEGIPGEVTTPIERAPHVSVYKTARLPYGMTAAEIGSMIEYEVTAVNDGNVTLNDIRFTDTLVGADSEQAAQTLAPGESARLVFRYKVTQDDAIAGNIVNVALIDAGTPDGCDPIENEPASIETLVIAKPHISVTKTSDESELSDPPVVGDRVFYEITIVNDGDIDLNELFVEDVLSNGKHLNLGEIPDTIRAGETLVFNTSYPLDQNDIDNGGVNNSVVVRAVCPTQDHPVLEEHDETSSEIDRYASMTVEKKAVDEAEIWSSIDYDIIVTNTGNVTLHNVCVTDELTGDVNVHIAEKIEPGEQASMKVTYPQITENDAANGSVINIAHATADPPEGTVLDNKDDNSENDDGESTDNKVKEEATKITGVTSSPSLFIQKTASVETLENAKAGDIVTWQFEVSNTGNITIEDIQIIDEMLTNAGYDILLTSTTLHPGEVAYATVDYAVTQNDIDAGIIRNHANVIGKSIGANDEPVTGGDGSEFEIKVDQTSMLAINKHVSQEVAEIGDELQYAVEIENAGNVTLFEVYLTDAALGNLVASELLSPGESVVLEDNYVVTEDDAIAAIIESPALASAKAPENTTDPNPVEGYVKTEVISHPAVSLEKTSSIEKNDTKQRSDDSMVLAGDTVTWNFKVTNTGDITLKNIIIHDDMLENRGVSVNIEEGAIIAPGESIEASCSHVLTQEDIDNGALVNVAYCEATSTDNQNVRSADVTAVQRIEYINSVNVVKKADKTYVANAEVGEIITYKVTVENTGNTTLQNVKIVDELEGTKIDSITIGDLDSGSSQKTAQAEIENGEFELAPGQKAIATILYDVTENDINEGRVVNNAHVEFVAPTPIISDDDNDGKNGNKVLESDVAKEVTVLIPPEKTTPIDEALEFLVADEEIALGGFVSDIITSELVQTGDAGRIVFIVTLLGAAVAIVLALTKHRRKR